MPTVLCGAQRCWRACIISVAAAMLQIPAAGWAQTASPAPAPIRAAPAPPPTEARPDGFSLSGSLRFRIEALDDQFRPELDPSASAIFLRTTLAGQYRAGPVRLSAELIDARAYRLAGRNIISANDVNTVELSQAFVGFDLGHAAPNAGDVSIDIGRFTMDLGSRRLVGRNMFRNAVNSFTGVRAHATAFHGLALTAFATLPHNRLPSDRAGIDDNRVAFDRESTALILWGVFGARSRVIGRTTLEAYLIGLHERDASGFPTRDRQLYTAGVRLLSEPRPGQTDFEIEGVYQTGSASRTTAASDRPIPVSAWFLHAEIGHQFAARWQPRVSARIDIASGDRAGARYTRFDTLFGVRRLDFGPTGLFGPLGRNNIISPGVKLDVTPDKRWDGFIAYRAALLESATDSFSSTGIRDPSGRSGRFAGHQIEARARYWMVPQRLRVDVGAATLINGEFLQRAANANRRGNPLYGYVDLTVTF